ncbi:MAG TPA: hypothetical protein VH062_14430 [Polyangiaceae bacterium]|nr:hypothetical protein [Polyangiaceae bacterium]
MTTATNPDAPVQSQDNGAPLFLSTFKEGDQRFLAYAIEHSFVCGRRTPQDFIRHFPPRAIMKGLENQAGLRAAILVLTTGLKQKIALKKEWEDAATDLQIALDEGETDAESIVALFDADDRVRYLDAQKIWSFLTEGEFWKASTNKTQADVARNHIAFMLERALADKLISHRDVVEGVTVEELANRLPKAELGRLIQCALQNADRGSTFTEADLLATTPARTLVQYVPLSHLWDNVVVPKIARRHNYITEANQGSKPETSKPDAAKVESSKFESPKHETAAELQELPKPQVQDAPVTNTAAKEMSLKPVAKPKESGLKDAPPKEISKIKLKSPDGMNPMREMGKTPLPFGDESDDIEVTEDDLKAM